MDNRLAGLGALEFGALTGIQNDIYLAAVWIRAAEAMQYLAAAMDDAGGAAQAAGHHTRARDAFEQFWDDETGQYVYAFAEDRSRVSEVTPWSAVGLMWGYGQPDRATRTLETLSSAELTTDWGVRMLSHESRYFEPLNYNYGAVWPFLTSWVNTAQYKRGFALQGYSALMSTAQHIDNRALGHVTEVFSGVQHTWPQESVPHQGFGTAGTVLPFIRGLLGLEGSVPDHTLAFEPSLPAHWDHVTIENYRLGDAVFSIEYHRYDDAVAVEISQQGGTPYRMHFSPSLSPGTGVVSATVNGAPVTSDLQPTGQVVRPTYTFDLGATVLVEIRLQPGLEVVPPVWASEIGDRSRGLKILAFDVDADTAQLTLEGLAGQANTLGLRHTGRVDQVMGGALDGDVLHVTFPEGPAGTFVRHDVVMRLRNP
jgi:hypothetical protein